MFSILRVTLTKHFNSILGHFGYGKILHKELKNLSFSDREVFQSLVFEALMQGIDWAHPGKREHLLEMSKKIVARVANLETMTFSEFVKNRLNPIMATRNINFTIGAGIACFWEVQVKLLAQKIGIDIYNTVNSKNAKSPGIKDIEPIIDEIKAKLPQLDFKFGRLINLRNAAVHGNFHQLRAYASPGKTVPVRETYKGNVVMGSFNNAGRSQNLSEITEFDEIKEAGLFSWFLDTGNSALFEDVMLEFQNGIEVLDAVIGMHALSFNETKEYFDKICVQGKKLSDEEKELFIKCRKDVDFPPGSNKRMIELIENIQRS